jgi:hypothetical protein
MVDLSFIPGLNDRKPEPDLDLLEDKFEIAMAALTAIGNTETSDSGQASQMAWTARETLKKIKELYKSDFIEMVN